MGPELLAPLIGFGAAVFITAVVIICWKYKCCGACGGGGYDNMPTFHEEGTASDQLWVGQNPTDRQDITPEIIVDSNEVADRTRTNIRQTQNFCRSCLHERRMLKTLEDIGHRSSRKFYSLISDAVVNRDASRDVETLLCKYNVPLGKKSIIDHSSERYRKSFVTMLKSLRHPYLLSTPDCGYSRDTYAFFCLRRWSPAGSLRDLIYGVRDPQRPFDSKYPGTQHQMKRAKPMEVADIAKYGRQILEGLKYLDDHSFPYYHLHCGNIIMANGNCKLTDYENAFFKFKSRVHPKIKKHYAPQLASFGIVLFEMATGCCIPLNSTVALVIDDKQYREINNVLNFIFDPEPAGGLITVDKLISHPFFNTVPVTTLRTPAVDRADRVLAESTRVQKMMELTDAYFRKLYKVAGKRKKPPTKAEQDMQAEGEEGSKYQGQQKRLAYSDDEISEDSD